MALTKIITDTIDLSSDTTALKMPKGTTAQRPDVLTVDYLVVAGGGGGGWLGGGGGAGGYLTDSVLLSTSSAYSVIIGAGGSGGNSGSPGGGSGTNSKFTSSIEATGGGSGGGHATTAPGIGGSGGGGPSSGSFYNGAAGTTGQGNSGGDNVGNYGTGYGAGGGGGAGSAGVNGTSTTGGNGGNGLQNNLDGNNYYYAAGGGGGVQLTNTAGTGGSSIGGDGASDGNAGSNASPANRGSGGGGGGYSSAGVFGDGGNGSDGIIIISVPVNYTATFTSGVTANGVSGGGAISPNTATGYNVWVITVTTDALQTVTFSGTAPTIGTTRENTTTGKMEIYTGAKGWRALQQTGQDGGVVPSNNFKTVLYTGNSTSGAYTDVPYGQQNIEIGFTSDLSWFKTIGSGSTGLTSSTAVYDVIRGDYHYMNTNSQYPSGTSGVASGNAGGARLTNGVTVGDITDGSYSVNGGSSASAYTNTNYVSWNWKAGGQPTTSNSNTGGSMVADSVSIDGVLQSSYTPSGSPGVYPKKMSINTEAGFNIVEWENPGSPYTQSIPHGLSGAPDLMIVKLYELGPGAAGTWFVYTKTTGEDAYLKLNLNDSVTSGSGYEFINVGADTFQFSYSTGAKTVGYFFKSTPGFSLIGSYTGTGSATNTPRIYTGFEPAWIMVKRTNYTGAWNITDNKRNTSNPRNSILEANAANPEYSNVAYNINFYNDGFQINNNHVDWNTNDGKYIFMCFAS
tara:strand:- start:946 stop:3150 length:2205 start_codon:yes stop_codon:yes gene_type:complete